MKNNKVRKPLIVTIAAIFALMITISPKYIQAMEVQNEIYKNAVEQPLDYNVKTLDQCKKAIADGELKIAFVGDSITEGCDLRDSKNNYVNVLVDRIKEELPEIKVEYKNFSLGARYLGDFVNDNYKAKKVESNCRLDFSREWAPEGKTWKDCVKDFKPDLVILAFGMNDAFALKNSEEMFYNNMNKFACELNNWIKKPDLVLVSTILPTKNKWVYNQSEDITNALANVTRLFAKEKGYMLADANRLFQILRDGKDILIEEEKKYEDKKEVSRFLNGTIEFDINFDNISKEKSADILYRKNDLGSAILRLKENKDNSYTAGLYISDNKTIYEDIDGSGSNTIKISKNTLGNHMVVITNEKDEELTPYKEAIIPATKENKPHRIKIVTENTKHNIYIDDKLVFDINIYRKLTPGKIEIRTKYEKNLTVKNMTITAKESCAGKPIYSEEKLLGTPMSGNGNGANHPSSFGHRVVYGEAFNRLIKELKN